MKYLKKFNENKRFDKRDHTNLVPVENEWQLYNNRDDAYNEIESNFGIKYDELGYIIVDFIERFDLCYRCELRDDNEKRLIMLELFPNVDIDRLYDDDLNFVKWLYNKMPGGKESDEYLPFLEEIDSRLFDYNLTIRDLLPKDYRKDNLDFPFDFFASKKYIQLWIGKK